MAHERSLPSSLPSPTPPPPADWRAGTFAHHRLDAFAVARDALAAGHQIARRIPRGYAKLTDQLTRALLGAYLQVAEAAARTGADRAARFRAAGAEASEAAAALEAVVLLGLGRAADVATVVGLLARLCAMCTRLAARP